MGDARGAGRRTDGGRESRRKRRGELALFYRKGLIALPITDNATINDLREVGVGEWRKGGKDRRGEAGKRDRDGDRDVVENGNESWESGCGGGGGRERWKEAIRAYIRVARCTTQVKGGKQEEQSARVKGGKRTIRSVDGGPTACTPCGVHEIPEDGRSRAPLPCSPKGTDWLSTRP